MGKTKTMKVEIQVEIVKPLQKAAFEKRFGKIGKWIEPQHHHRYVIGWNSALVMIGNNQKRWSKTKVIE